MYLPSQVTAIRRQTAKEPKGPATRATPNPASSAYKRKSGMVLWPGTMFTARVIVYHIAMNIMFVIVVMSVNSHISWCGTAE